MAQEKAPQIVRDLETLISEKTMATLGNNQRVKWITQMCKI